MDEKEILSLFESRDEDAIFQTRHLYGQYIHYIAMRILGSPADAEEVTNDVLFKAWNSIPPAKPASLRTWLGMLSRQLAINRYQQIHAQKRGATEYELGLEELAECLPDKSADISAESIDLRRIMTDFVSSLKKKPREIFLRRYWYVSAIKQGARVIVDEEGIRAAAYAEPKGAGAMAPSDNEVFFTLDRPFLFVIISEDGLPLYAGAVREP